MMLGSCFTQNIGKLFKQNQFDITINPFGITYNPLSIAQSLDILLSDKIFTIDDLTENQERHVSLLHHREFYFEDEFTTLLYFNSKLKEAREKIKQIDFLFITLGTNTYFEYNKNKLIVNNCHKLPAKEFTKKEASIEDIFDKLNQSLNQLKSINPKCKFIFSISPIRYAQDGHFANSINKSTLILATQKLMNEHENSYYFPAYEIILDDLRDYRFYKEDMNHPNDVAIKYIWNGVMNLMIDEKSKIIIEKVEKINLMKAHRPINPYSDAHKKFLENIEKEISILKNTYKNIKFNL
jgi:hypothetical protein